jgi:glutathione peroxidase
MNIFEHTVKKINGEQIKLSEYKGKVILIVNTASKCGFTPQYDGLEEIYQEYKDRGFVVLGFPCNQFGEQEQGSNDEIAQFCKINHGVTFPLFSKIEVNGDGAHPLYKDLKKAAPGLLGSESIKWNFTKFLVSKDGKNITRYASTTKPESLREDIEAALVDK